MTDDLARRFAARQLQLAADDLVRDAERLARDARAYADTIASGNPANAHRLAQDAAALAYTERRLAGMREMASLLDTTPDPGSSR